MRKKSHISLAQYIVNSLNDEGLKKHKLSFYIGSILPDIKPSFVYKRHEINGTYGALQRNIVRLTEGNKLIQKKKKGRKYYMDLGQISHYLADYFTFPHNDIYPGTLKEHCSYEEMLKHDLRAYIKSGAAARQEKVNVEFLNAEHICEFVWKAHKDYLETKHSVENDIHHIIEINHRAVEGMIELLTKQRKEYAVLQA